MKLYKFFSLTTALLLLLVFTACDKDEDIIKDPPLTDSQKALNVMTDYVLVNKLFSDAANEADAAAKDADDQIGGETRGQKNGYYPVVTVSPFDTVTWPKTVTVDYGESNFLCQDGRYRRGKIIFEISYWYHVEGTVLTVNFDDYYQDDHKLDGTKVITNTGRNSDNNLVYTVEINDGLVITPDEKEIYYEQNSQREWIEGEDTPLNVCDDVYLIDGVQSGISSDNVTYSITVIESLDVRVCCKYIRDGVLDIDIQDLPTVTVNYGVGEGECNNKAVATILGIEFPFDMP